VNHFGLTDSIAALAGVPEKCPTCGSVSRLQNGLCPGCLLRLAVAGEETPEEIEDLGVLLAEVPLADTHWQIGNYIVLEEIGRGGMGVIYRARQRYSRRVVALKRILSYHADSPETLRRFRREAEAAASLDHPNILPIFEVAETEEKLPFFTMKFAPGGSLLEAAPAFRRDPRSSVELMIKVARALQYAHERGILHRDLKPGNILLDAHDAPLISDFGLAKWLDTDSDITRTLMIFGTPGYVAPEQARGGDAKVGPAADIYSLGAMLFELLAGRPPFLGPHALSVIQQAAQNPAPKLRSLCRWVDRDLETICARCLEAEPQARLTSAGELADELERWLHHRPIRARPISVATRIWKWGRRNPLLTTALTGCLVIGAIAVARYQRTVRLEEQVRESESAAHAVAMAPLLDLDHVAADTSAAAVLTNSLAQNLARVGPSRVAAMDASDRWTGIGYEEEIIALARRRHTHAVLTGTVRRVGGNLRIALHLVGEDGQPALPPRLVEIKPEELDHIFGERMFLNSIFHALTGERSSAAAPHDPIITNERASAFMLAGRDLMGRRSIPEMDRAIACFEGAVEAAPGSPNARSFLAMALQGRDLLGSDGRRWARALQLARDAVALAPNDPTTHRALCALCASNGMPDEAIEHGLRAIELGDRSGRAFGQLGYALRMRGRPDQAIRWYYLAKAKNQQPADFDALLGDCWADIARDDEAERCYKSAATFHPDQPEGWIGLARLQLLHSNFEAARQLDRAQILHYPESMAARQFAGLIEFFARNFDAAGTHYQALHRDDPLGGGRDGAYGALDYRSALARVKLAQGDRRGADDLLAQIIASAKDQLQSAPADAQILYRLAAAEAMRKDTHNALADLKRAIVAGWLDHRSPQLDPRFDNIAQTAEFGAALSELAARVAGVKPPSLPADAP
jgi:tetratricopeptide (TPR) repeat protein